MGFDSQSWSVHVSLRKKDSEGLKMADVNKPPRTLIQRDLREG